MSRTLSGLFLVGALNRPRKSKRANRENPRTIPEQIRRIPEKSGKPQKGQKRTKKEGQVQIGKPPRLKPPRLAALEKTTTTAENFGQENAFPKYALLVPHPLGSPFECTLAEPNVHQNQTCRPFLINKALDQRTFPRLAVLVPRVDVPCFVP